MIRLVTGAPGSGKSYYAVASIVDGLAAGKVVATNVKLAPDWSIKAARSNIITRAVPGRVLKRAADFRRRLYQAEDLDELFAVRLHGRGEGRGLMVLDEAHNWMNARTWDADETGKSSSKAEAVRRRLAVVKFFSAHRHYGWDVLLITQDEQNIDRQVRSLYEFHTYLKNAKRFRPAGIPVCPFNFFLAITLWNDKAKTRAGTNGRRLNRTIAAMYDTHGLARELDDDPNATWLPFPSDPAGGVTPKAPAGRPAPAGHPAAAHARHQAGELRRGWSDETQPVPIRRGDEGAPTAGGPETTGSHQRIFPPSVPRLSTSEARDRLRAVPTIDPEQQKPAGRPASALPRPGMTPRDDRPGS